MADDVSRGRTKLIPTSEPSGVSFADAFRIWIKVALYSFGGPAGQISVMHKLLVEKKRWVSENRFLHALNYTMLLPGPEAQQLTIYIGWLLHGYRGGLIAGTLFVLPGFLSILVLSFLYASFQGASLVEAFFYGLKPVVMAIVAEAVIRIGRRALQNKTMIAIAAAAFIGIFFFNLPFPLIVLSAGLAGFLGGKIYPQTFAVIRGHEPASVNDAPDRQTFIVDTAAQNTDVSLARSFKILVIHLALWFGPLIALALWLGPDHVLVAEGIFFSQAAVVTFGGAYAVLAYIAQEAVNTHRWLEAEEMLVGLGMAESTPGPLIQIVQFVGYMGAYRNPEPFDPIIAAVLGSIVVTWVTFVPCFLWIFLGAPYIESLRNNQSLTTALSAITAAVVGVILNLAVWFSIQTLFADVHETQMMGMELLIPIWSSLDIAALVIAVTAFIALVRYHIGIFKVLAVGIAVGFLYHLWMFG